jgi:hypothetical protein
MPVYTIPLITSEQVGGLGTYTQPLDVPDPPDLRFLSIKNKNMEAAWTCAKRDITATSIQYETMSLHSLEIESVIK